MKNKFFETLFKHLSFEGNGIENFKLLAQVSILNKCLEQLSEIHKIVSWNVLKEEVEKQGAEFLIKAVENWFKIPIGPLVVLDRFFSNHMILPMYSNVY